MWPWEHLAIGYLAYAVLSRVAWRRPPTAAAAVAVAFGTQFPDLVDKPLGWVLGVTPGGTTVAHSLLTAVPLCLAVVVLGILVRRERVALAFTVGYLAHLPADALYPVVLGGEPKLWFLLWPLWPAPGSGPAATVPHFLGLVAQYLDFLASPFGIGYLLAELLLVSLAAWVWLQDGLPGLKWRPSGA